MSEPGAAASPLFDLPRETVSERYEILRHGSGGAPTGMVCGAVRFHHPTARQLVALLPRTIVVDSWTPPQVDWVRNTLRLMAEEASELRPGGEIVITRLGDILVIQAIRSWIARDPAAQTGWLSALRDPQVGRAIALVHRQPGRAWTLRSLAGEAAMSRSAFASRFNELVGEPAMRYVTRFKMQLAAESLKEEGARVGELASRLGYRSEAAFSRAFKRHIGVSPGAAMRDRKHAGSVSSAGCPSTASPSGRGSARSLAALVMAGGQERDRQPHEQRVPDHGRPGEADRPRG